MPASEAFVTLVTNDQYALGGLVLAHSLKETGTTRDLVCMVTQKLSADVRQSLEAAYSLVVEVDELNSQDEVNLGVHLHQLSVLHENYHVCVNVIPIGAASGCN
jgi:glycogenin glucosyltransferase